MVRKDPRSVDIRAGNKARKRAQKQEHNNPVPVEEFDREHMGIAAKE